MRLEKLAISDYGSKGRLLEKASFSDGDLVLCETRDGKISITLTSPQDISARLKKELKGIDVELLIKDTVDKVNSYSKHRL